MQTLPSHLAKAVVELVSSDNSLWHVWQDGNKYRVVIVGKHKDFQTAKMIYFLTVTEDSDEVNVEIDNMRFL